MTGIKWNRESVRLLTGWLDDTFKIARLESAPVSPPSFGFLTTVQYRLGQKLCFAALGERPEYIGAAQRIRLRYFWFRNVDPWLLAAASAGSSRRTGSVSSQRGHESRRRCSRIPRPPGLTVSDRSTMWSLSPAHAPPIPPPHIPTPGPVL